MARAINKACVECAASARAAALSRANVFLHRKGGAYSIAALIVAVLLVFTASPCNAQPSARNVLILDESGPAGLSPGYAEIVRTFRQTLVGKSPAQVFAMNLDLNQFSGPEYSALLKRYIQEKYRNTPIDVLVAVGPSALEFALQVQSELWPKTAIVFVATDEGSAARLIPSPRDANVTGRTIRISFAKTLEVARILVPDLQKVAVVGDVFEKQPFRRHFKAELEAVAPDLTLIDLTGMPIDTVKSQVSNLPSDAAIIYTTMTNDGAGATVLPHEMLIAIAEVANRPIVVDIDNRVGMGGTGGFVVRPSLIGEEGALLVNRLLEGERADSIPISPSAAMQLAFDSRQLPRWGIDEGLLPAFSDVRFQEPPLTPKARLQLALMVGAILFQSVLITCLLYEDRRRRRAEARSLELSEDLAHVNRVATAGELAASITHEIRQPLSAIVARGSAGLNWLKRSEPDLGKIRVALENIVESGHRADEILRNTRAMFAKQDTLQVPLNVNRVVEEVLTLAAGRITENGVRLVTSLSETPVPNVKANRSQLHQVMLNLVTNAVEAMSGEGRRDRVLTLATEVNSSGHVLIIVRDSGPGVPADQLDYIFKSFFTTKPNGMGVGLAVCKSIVEAHAGQLKAMPAVPSGMIFTVELPLFGRRDG